MRKLIIFEIYSLDKLLNKNQLCQKAETDSHISDQVEMDIKRTYGHNGHYVIMLHFIS